MVTVIECIRMIGMHMCAYLLLFEGHYFDHRNIVWQCILVMGKS